MLKVHVTDWVGGFFLVSQGESNFGGGLRRFTQINNRSRQGDNMWNKDAPLRKEITLEAEDT